MTKKTSILTGLLICVLVVCAGLATGIYFKNKKSSEAGGAPVASMALDVNTAKPKKTDPNSGTYDVSPPSRGVTLSTYDIDIKPVGNITFMALPKKDAGAVEVGQKILLYDAEGIQLEILGEVTKVFPGTGPMEDFITVHISLNGDETVPPAKVAKGKIIINRDPNSQRLPLSALVKDDKNDPYVWEITDNGNGTGTVAYTPANVVSANYAFFVIEQLEPRSNVFVLNPDKKLQDGQTINISNILYSVPDQTDESRITALVEARNRIRSERITAMINKANGKAADAGPVAPAEGCTAPPPGAGAFIEQIKKMAPESPQSLPTSP